MRLIKTRCTSIINNIWLWI